MLAIPSLLIKVKLVQCPITTSTVQRTLISEYQVIFLFIKALPHKCKYAHQARNDSKRIYYDYFFIKFSYSFIKEE